MAAQSFSLVFQGYWRDVNKAGVPAASGVYCVYAGTHNRTAGTVSLRKLLYIGEADDCRLRIAGHEKTAAWRRHLQPGEVLCFSFAPVAALNRARVEAALIFRYKPPVNTEYVNSFPFDRTSITTTGRNALLAASFTVDRTASVSSPTGTRW